MLKAPTDWYDAYIFDLDGTIYLGDGLLPGAKRLIEGLRANGKVVKFLSNNPTKDPHMYQEKLERLGLPTSLDDIANTVVTTTRWLTDHHPDAKLFVIGEEPLQRALRGAGFTLTEGHPNEAAGGKRPMHTIIPGMIRQNGRVLMPFGVMGGAYQPCGHARFVTNLVDYGLDLQEAMDAPRCFSGPEGMEVERGYSDKVRSELAAMGHQVVIPQTPLGGSQAIRIDGDVLVGASDPRKDGCALGY